MRPIEKVLKTTLRDLVFENSAAVEAVVRLLRASNPGSPIIRPETYDSRSDLLSLALATCTSIIGLVGLTGDFDNEDVFKIVLVGGAAWWLLAGGVLLRRPLRTVWRLLHWRFSIAWERFLFPDVDDWPARAILQGKGTGHRDVPHRETKDPTDHGGRPDIHDVPAGGAVPRRA
jgi:hypothetical protein